MYLSVYYSAAFSSDIALIASVSFLTHVLWVRYLHICVCFNQVESVVQFPSQESRQGRDSTSYRVMQKTRLMVNTTSSVWEITTRMMQKLTCRSYKESEGQCLEDIDVSFNNNQSKQSRQSCDPPTVHAKQIATIIALFCFAMFFLSPQLPLCDC